MAWFRPRPRQGVARLLARTLRMSKWEFVCFRLALYFLAPLDENPIRTHILHERETQSCLWWSCACSEGTALQGATSWTGNRGPSLARLVSAVTGAHAVAATDIYRRGHCFVPSVRIISQHPPVRTCHSRIPVILSQAPPVQAGLGFAVLLPCPTSAWR